jgi:hypothetical protein
MLSSSCIKSGSLRMIISKRHSCSCEGFSAERVEGQSIMRNIKNSRLVKVHYDS